MDYIEIRKLLKNGMQHKDIAKIFNVSQTAITDINIGRKWKHVK